MLQRNSILLSIQLLFLNTVLPFSPGARDEYVPSSSRPTRLQLVSHTVKLIKQAASVNKKSEINCSPENGCAICTEVIDAYDGVVMQCGHNDFHAHCIEQWKESANSPSCPICRAPLVLLIEDKNTNSSSQPDDRDRDWGPHARYENPSRSWSGGAPGY